MMSMYLDFEGRLEEIDREIERIVQTASPDEEDVLERIRELERRKEELLKEIYSNLTPWQKVLVARHPNRPKTSDFIKLICSDFIELRGDRFFGDDPAILGGLAIFEGRPVVLVGVQKATGVRRTYSDHGLVFPEGYRKALRIMKLGEKFHKPVICLIDVPGAFPGPEAEQRGISRAIAMNLMSMAFMRTRIISVITGEGGSGGAIALAVADRVLMFEHAYYSVILPEGCASIIWRDEGRAAEAAEALKLTAQDALRLGVIDEIIPEPVGGAHRDYEGAAANLADAIRRNLSDLEAMDMDTLLEMRYMKFRRMGQFAVAIPEKERIG
jgi:acetyl-CoA carboxylase carboxyl transferase subunit alpha